MKVIDACVISTLGSSLTLNAAALLANETCYQSGKNSDGYAYPFAALNLIDDQGFRYLGFSKLKALINQALGKLLPDTGQMAKQPIDCLYLLISKRCIHNVALQAHLQQLHLGIPVILVQGDSCRVIEIINEVSQTGKRAVVLAYDDLNNPSQLTPLFDDDRVKHSENAEGLVPGEVLCGIVLSPEPVKTHIHYDICAYSVELETVDTPGKIVRANALVKLVKSLLHTLRLEYHDLSIRFADLNGESPRNFETAISTARLQNQPMDPRLLSLNTVTPCGDAGTANGVLQLAMLYGMCSDPYLREKIALRTEGLSLHQLYGEDGRRGGLITKFDL